MYSKVITDFHTHILPGIDDGSKDIEMTKKLLMMEANDGITNIVFTPHFYASRTSFDGFFEKREKSYEKVIEILKDDSVPYNEDNLSLGAEVYFFDGISQAANLDKLCIGNTNTVLIEMPFSQWNKSHIEEIESIIDDRNLKVVIAHIERFVKYQKNKKYFDELISMPLTLQMNAEAFAGSFFDKRHALKFIKDRNNIVLGSDCHDLSARKPNLAAARDLIIKKAGEECINTIDKYAVSLLEN